VTAAADRSVPCASATMGMAHSRHSRPSPSRRKVSSRGNVHRARTPLPPSALEVSGNVTASNSCRFLSLP
jgi:hypothetical protein